MLGDVARPGLLTCLCSQDNIEAVLALAHEYDIAGMMQTAEEWLVNATECSVIFRGGDYDEGDRYDSDEDVDDALDDDEGFSTYVKEWTHFLRVVRSYKLKAFADAIDKRVDKLTLTNARLLLKTETAEAIQGATA